MERMELLLGSDVTVKCPCPKSCGSDCSVIIPAKNSSKEICYEDSLYVFISNVGEKNKGNYRCIKDGMATSSTILEIKESNIQGEKTVFRTPGEDLLLLCSDLRNITHLTWEWTSSDTGKRKTIEVNVKSENASCGQFYRKQNYHGVKLTVSFNHSGQYKCNLRNNTPGIIINLVTVEVKASPSPSASYQSNASITCTLSHVYPGIGHVSLVWAQEEESTFIPVKKHNVTSHSKQISHTVTGMNESSVNWTCLVFRDNSLVAAAPLTLKYISTQEIHPTTSAVQAYAKPSGRQDPNKAIIVILCVIFFLFLGLAIIGFFHRLTSVARASNMQGLSSNLEEIQYASVSFHLQKNGDERNLICSDNSSRPEQQEVLYIQVKQTGWTA
ncbi:uncharacterized protein [Hyperolius riggenbachi]|uniref:uncharacterized protein n=1 Tax=Hyperolius riggenbachi TaxID=752182 RepID=UPI0035A31DBC